MSDLYQLALALRQAPDDSINLLVQERSLSLADYQDFFDLANAILSPKSQLLLQAAIPNQSLIQLRALLQEQKIPAAKLNQLREDFLVYGDPPRVYDWLRDKLLEKPRTQTLSALNEAIEFDQSAIDSDCGIHAFEAMQAITELIFDFDQHLIREVGRGSIGLPDIKRLSQQLGKPKEYVRSIFDLARLVGIVALSDKRFQPTDLAESWMTKSPQQRWQLLAEGYLLMLSAAGANELQLQLKNQPGKVLSELLNISFPLALQASGSRIGKLAELADQLGLASGLPASWLSKLTAGDAKAAAKALAERLPAQQGRILIQADLSIIAPGPLPSDIEVLLRRFSQTESIGLASSYRLSAQSLSLGMESGLSANQIKNFLEKLSTATLPQPVEYLIRESGERFGRIKIFRQPKGARLSVDSELLKKQLLMDSKLKQLLLGEDGEGLISPLESEVLYHSLRDAGYLAIRVDEAGKLLDPKSRHHSATLTANFKQQLQRLREQDFALEEQTSKSEMERKIHLALRSKSMLEVEINANGKQLSFLLEPIGVANGRLRARDRKADIERTLPVSAITSISIG